MIGIDVGGFKVEIPHHFISDEDDYHEWVHIHDPDEHFVMRDWLGRRNGQTYRWIKLRCNNPSCRATAIVREEELSRLLEEVALL